MSPKSLLTAIALKPGLSHMRREMIELEEILAARRTERMCRDIKYQLAAARFQTALIRYAYVCHKAGFRRDQPRWPQGTSGEPKPGGRWSGGAGTGAPMTEPSANPKSRGHHWVSRQVFEKEPLKPETRKVFEDATTGPLRGQKHGNSREHMEYNKAAQEAIDNFKVKNGIARSEDMTPEQAKKFVGEIKASTDPRIRSLNVKIFMQEFQFYLRRLPRRIE
ncbi:MAG: hypothetical protein HYX37_19695 [Rhizobiales bacterium]|nr:hypothetical protein [Hyphomicrobiales bacterium]